MNIDTILKASISETAKSEVFTELRDNSKFFSDRESYENDLKVFEDEYMEQEFGDEPAAKKKNGEWKYRTYLPQAYTSAKAVICTAFDLGVDMFDEDGDGLGKSAIQKATKEAKASTDSKSDQEKASIQANNLYHALRKLDEHERNEVLQAFSEAAVNGGLFNSISFD